MHAARELQHVLEQNWGAVGGGLRFAKTLPEVRDAFKQVQGTLCSRLDIFTRSETHRSTGNALRKLRKQLQQTREDIYKATVAQRYARDWHQRAQQDWTHETDEPRKRELQHASSVWRGKSEEADQIAKNLQARWDGLEEELRKCEAYFAQSEVLEFIRSGRREFMPFNIAAAMAGMPHLTARVSCQRVWAQKPQGTKGFAYELFQVFKAKFSESPRDLASAIRMTREYLVAENRAKSGPVKELRKNWYFIELAIHSALQEPKGPRGSLPFRIFAAYMHRFTCQQRGDQLLAETKRLVLKDERPELEGLPDWN